MSQMTKLHAGTVLPNTTKTPEERERTRLIGPSGTIATSDYPAFEEAAAELGLNARKNTALRHVFPKKEHAWMQDAFDRIAPRREVPVVVFGPKNLVEELDTRFPGVIDWTYVNQT